MMRKISVLILMLIMISAFNTVDVLPEGWFKAGTKKENYTVHVDDQIKYNGAKSVGIRSNEGLKKKRSFATVMQRINAKAYRNKKIKISAQIKSEDIKGWAGLWFRIDGHSKREMLGFDNMNDRKIRGTSDWTKYEIIMDVPENSRVLNYGVLLSGKGKVWFDDFNIEIMNELSVENGKWKSKMSPENIGFEN